MLRRLLLIALAGALLTACGSGEETGASTATQGGSQHNDADMTFVSGMVPHHQEAVEMAELVESRTQRPELRALADTIITTQNQEISLMQGWQRAWGQEGESGGMDHGSEGGGASMPGTMPKAHMDELTQLKNTAFDLAFVRMMIEHHQGAVEMAETELRDGANAEAKQLARKIIADQRKEIEMMTKWQKEWTA
jgi:uncharacterized protein (DUF305 family)